MLVKERDNQCECCGYVRRPIMEWTEVENMREPKFVPPHMTPHPNGRKC